MTMNELWTLLNKCSTEKGEFPRIRAFASYSNLAPETIAKVYRKWYEEGKLIRNGNYYDFPNNKKIQIQSVQNKKHLIEKIKSDGISSLSVKEKKSVTQLAIRILMGFIGVILIACSVHFTYEFNSLAMDKLWGWLLSFAVVVFTSFAFTVKSYMEKKRTKIAIIILWILGISYSVFTAVSGQFNDFRKYNASDNSMVIQNQNSILKEQLKVAKKKQVNLEHWRFEEAEYTRNPDLKTENPGTWRTIQNGVKQLSLIEDEIKDIENKLYDNVTINNVENETIYNWLASFLHIKASVIQFIIVLFPALFIDLCSSICLAFALGKKQEK